MKSKRKKLPKYKSRFEADIAASYPQLGYEEDILYYTVPETKRKYVTDWKIGPHTYIESKGKLTAEDRKKLLFVKEQHPEVKLYILFQNASNRITKKSKTTYADWCDKNGIEWADWKTAKRIPEKWLRGNKQKKKLSSLFNK
jgi:hypothetical protein